ncbi:MAG: sigma-70 family RNA polymerase sigma factor [Clostridia bacterium]|nr:sigma-70 family RNA polymerase sigma factor [Clostridia bacterium]
MALFLRNLFQSAEAHRQFERIYADCRTAMRGYALRLMNGDEDLADDVTQDAFIRIARNLPKTAVMDAAALHVYALKTVRSAAEDLMRKRRHFPVLVRDDDEPEPEPGKGGDPVLDALCEKDSVERIAGCIRRLPVKYREIFYLYFVDELNLREIAESLRMSPDTVRRRFSRGKQLLAQELKKGGILDDGTT